MSVSDGYKIQLLGTGVCLPRKQVTSADIDFQQGYRPGYTESKTGVKSRYYATTESASELAVAAIQQALSVNKLAIDDVDCLIAASGTMEQSIPCNAAKIHARLALSRPIPAFDINMTCLSALMAMDMAISLLASGRYKKILIVSSEIASVGINLQDIKTAGIFGDGAAAIILSACDEPVTGPCPQVLTSHFETHSEGVDLCEIRGGGSLNHPSKIEGDYQLYGQFQMKGKELYKLTARIIDGFIDRALSEAGLSLQHIDWVVPHQASAYALSHLQKRLSLPDKKMINIFSTHGNQIAASIPTALHTLMHQNKLKKGDHILLIGTSAGLSIGCMVWKWS